jgi:hypothetical protein
MKKKLPITALIAVVCALVFVLASCPNPADPGGDPSPAETAAAALKAAHSAVLAKTVEDVAVTDEAAVDAALAAYEALSAEAKALLGPEKTLLDSLKARIDELKAPADAAAFKTAHSAVLAKTTADITATDESAVDAALAAYEAISNQAEPLSGRE